MSSLIKSFKKNKIRSNYTELCNIPTTKAHVKFPDDGITYNRYGNVIPYDDNCLKNPYLNASIIGFLNKIVIATQAPTISTIPSFYTNIYNLGTNVILNLTPLSEGGYRKADKYWADVGESINLITYVGIPMKIFTIKETIINNHITVRELVINIGPYTQHTVHQIHYTGWQDSTIPDRDKYVDIYRIYYIFNYLRPKIPFIHCSAGIGRTGTFLAILIISLTKPSEGDDLAKLVMKTVKLLREQRAGMVQTYEQYVFIHNIIKMKDIKMEGMLLASGDMIKI